MSPFGWWIAIYFALAGLAAGLALSAVWQLLFGAGRAIASGRRQLFAAGLALGLGSIALILDLERPDAFWYILVHANPDSWIARGSRIIMVFMLLAGLAWLLARGESRLPGATRLVVVVCALFAVLLAVYPALVLHQERGRPLWHSPLLPFLFVVGAAHIAIVAHGAPRWLGGLGIAAEILVAFGYVATAPVRPGQVLSHVDGPLVPLLVLAAVASWLIPLALGGRDHRPGSRLMAIASVAVGCFALRSAVLLAGQADLPAPL
ncbi:MAG: NrfD/PsrC family molybdoenzyme membrane anchor subunit [Myxococcota bacterium]